MFGTLLASIAAGETADLLTRTKRAAIAYGFAALCCLLSLVFGLIAVYVWAAVRYGPINAAVGFAVVLLLVAIIAVVAYRIADRVHARRAAKRRAVDMKAIATTAAIAALPALLSRKPSAATLFVPVLGVVGYLIFKENSKPRAPRYDP